MIVYNDYELIWLNQNQTICIETTKNTIYWFELTDWKYK